MLKTYIVGRRRGGSNEYPQCMIWSKNKKIRYTPAHHSFSTLYIKWGLRGYTLHGHVLLMNNRSLKLNHMPKLSNDDTATRSCVFTCVLKKKTNINRHQRTEFTYSSLLNVPSGRFPLFKRLSKVLA